MTVELVMVMTTVDNELQAERLAEVIIANKLAACIQEINIKSHYRWQGRLENSNEILLLIKTTACKVDTLMTTIKQQHNYELPEIIALPVSAGLPAYFNWVASETAASGTAEGTDN